MRPILKPTLAVLAAGALIASGSVGTAVAGGLIHGKDIAKNTITQANLGPRSVGRSELLPGLARRGKPGQVGPAGPAGPQGLSGLEGAFYSVAYYDVGDTNAGAIATVACSPTSQDFTALAGGVQTLGLDGTPVNGNTPVSSSFPGRMDFTTNTPKPNRLDGWIVQFAGGSTTATPPETEKIWALCVPRTDIPVVQTFTQSD